MDYENRLFHHILPTSAQLVGVCVTVISLEKARHFGEAGMIISKLLVINYMLFTSSAWLSYASIRGYKMNQMEKYADQFFMVALLELIGCAILLAFEMI